MLAEVKDKKENTLKAIDYCKEALNFFNLNEYPTENATVKLNLANSYFGLYEAGKEVNDLKTAIDYYNKSAEVFTIENYPED